MVQSDKILRVMIVDDDHEDQEFLKFLFSRHSAFDVVECFDDGERAIEAIESGNIPDVLLIDLNMPKMNGVETAKYIREKGLAPDMHVFLISGFIDERQKQAFRSELINFLTKPGCLSEVNDIPGTILDKLGWVNPNVI